MKSHVVNKRCSLFGKYFEKGTSLKGLSGLLLCRMVGMQLRSVFVYLQHDSNRVVDE